jgi:hypothetical protein
MRKPSIRVKTQTLAEAPLPIYILRQPKSGASSVSLASTCRRLPPLWEGETFLGMIDDQSSAVDSWEHERHV